MGLHSTPASDVARNGWAFEDRTDAGTRLARLLVDVPLEDPVVLGLPRGGVPVAGRVAIQLHAPMDVLIVRKLGLPSHPEIAMGAIGEGGVRVLDSDIIRRFEVSPAVVAAVEERERAVLDARVTRLRAERSGLTLTGRTALIIDDGLATGSTATAACRVARALGAQRVVVAVPVASVDGLSRLAEADDVVCVLRPPDFTAVGSYYRNFEPTSDEEVALLLDVARRPGEARTAPTQPAR